MSDEPAYVAETLAWCNTKRAEQGKKPLKKLPKGVRFDGSTCPCGKATGWEVQSRYGYPPDWIKTYAGQELLPQGVREFVIAFDEGKLPQYDKTRRLR